MLDIALSDGMADFTIADHLAEKAIPFIFYSGRLSGDVPSRHSQRPFLSKPVQMDDLRRAMTMALSA